MSSRENISSDDLHALLHQLQASNASAVDHYGMTLQEIKDKAKKAHARLVDAINKKKKTP
jgi:hypothetical protein